MKKAVLFLTLTMLTGALFAQNNAANNRVLLGSFSHDSLLNEPFKTWFETGYNAYIPQPEVLEQLKKLNFNRYSAKVFMGTWCGDTKRELPRFLKILDAIGFPKQNVEIIGVSSLDDAYKQSPNHEERGLEIYRVATFVFYKNGVEANRIVEYPVNSLEADLLAIFSGTAYTPNYKTYPFIRQWLNDGTLVSDNTSPKGLANQLRLLVATPGELNACGYVLLYRGETKAATKIFRMNTILFYDNPDAQLALAEALAAQNEVDGATAAIERALALNKEPGAIAGILALYKKIVTLGKNT
ncbi:MAG: thioredoxin family protein [Saprospiraceae bacterium]|nr:thioredoxin family protein [Saprospiraceae bacterium]MDZ4704641.1 thioredoxin family protein [Saprospiraceae bacterium]